MGVSSILDGSETIETVGQQIELANLTIIPSGPSSSMPAELIAHPRFKEFLQDVRDKYDFVLLDSPPVFGASETLAIASEVDYSLLVVRLSAKNVRYLAQRAKDELANHGARILGLVSNGELAETKSYDYYPSDFRVVAQDGRLDARRSDPALRRAK